VRGCLRAARVPTAGCARLAVQAEAAVQQAEHEISELQQQVR
jgi:hypothetical protein